MIYKQVKQTVEEFQAKHGRWPSINELRSLLVQQGMHNRTEVYYFIPRLRRDGLDVLSQAQYVDMVMLNALYDYWRENGHSPTALGLRRITGLPAYTSLARLERQGKIQRKYRGYWPTDMQFMSSVAKPRLVQFVIDYTNQHGRQPSYDEIARGLGCAKSTVYKKVKRLTAMGIIQHEPRAKRAIVVPAP